MTVQKSLPHPSGREETVDRHRADDFTADSDTSDSDATTAVTSKLFSLGKWFGRSPVQRSYASGDMSSDDDDDDDDDDDESSQDEEDTALDFFTVGDTTAYTSEYGGGSTLGSAANSVIISLSHSECDSESVRDEIESQSRSYNRRTGRRSTMKASHRKKMIKVTTDVLSSKTPQDDTRDETNEVRVAVQKVERDSGQSEPTNNALSLDAFSKEHNIQKDETKALSSMVGDSLKPNLNKSTSSSAKNCEVSEIPNERSDHTRSMSTTCGDTVISTPSKAKAFLEQDDTTVQIFPAEALAISGAKGHWFGLSWLSQRSGNNAVQQSHLESSTECQFEDQRLESSEEQASTPEESLEIVHTGDRKEQESADANKKLSESIPSTSSPCPNEGFKIRRGLRGLFRNKRPKKWKGIDSTVREEESTSNEIPTEKERQIQPGGGLVSKEISATTSLFEDTIEGQPSTMPSELHKEQTTNDTTRILSTEAEIQQSAAIPLPLPVPSKKASVSRNAPEENPPNANRSIHRIKGNKLDKEGRQPKKNMSSTIPITLPKAITTTPKPGVQPSKTQDRKTVLWGKGTSRVWKKASQLIKGESSRPREALDLPTIDEEVTVPKSLPITDKESNIHREALQLSISANGAEDLKETKMEQGTQVQCSNSSVSHQSGKSIGSKVTKSTVTSGQSQETLKWKNRGIVTKLFRQSRPDTSLGSGGLKDMISKYEAKKTATRDGNRSVGFFLEMKRKRQGFPSVGEERHMDRGRNLMDQYKQNEIEENQGERSGFFGTTFCCCA